MSEQLVPVRVYIAVLVALLLLTGLTVVVAFQDLGPINTIVAISIAAVKAMLVILWFMHVRYSDQLTWIAVASGFLLFIVLLAITLSDYLTRSWIGIAGQ